MKRYGFFNAGIRESEISTANQRRIDDLLESLLNVNGVYDANVYQYSLNVLFHEDVVSVAEIDAIVKQLVTDAALNTTLFPAVKSNGKIKRHPATAELKQDKKTFTVTMSNSDARPTNTTQVGHNATKRVFDLNTMIVGLSPEDGSTQSTVSEEFKTIFGGKLASKLDGVTGWTVYNAQVEVSFYSTITSASDMDKVVWEILTEMLADKDHDNFFPHARKDADKKLTVLKTWNAK